MDTGYPALITEPLAQPGDPKTPKPAATVSASEAQTDSNPESSGTPATTTPVA